MTPKQILLLGSTGSIGASTRAVVDDLPNELEIVALAAHRSWESLLEQIQRYSPRSVALTDPNAAAALENALRCDGRTSSSPQVYSGSDGLTAMVRETPGNIVVGAISGAAGLPANLAALETGKDLALANKESLVLSGALLTDLARRMGRAILPVDSEHSAIHQSMLSGNHGEVRSIILTASGGPFRESTAEELRNATKVQALRHPTWKMGDKITIDSATLMNKALEIIEARWLFDMPPEKIRVLVHPQSIVHSLVEFEDGNVICQMGPPDMRVPIQYALTSPRRLPLKVERLRLDQIGSLTFFPPAPERFPALRLAYEVLEEGGSAPAVFNAANEVAVAAFLNDQIAFSEILAMVEQTLETHTVVDNPDLAGLLAADDWARETVRSQLEKSRPHSSAESRR